MITKILKNITLKNTPSYYSLSVLLYLLLDCAPPPLHRATAVAARDKTVRCPLAKGIFATRGRSRTTADVQHARVRADAHHTMRETD